MKTLVGEDCLGLSVLSSCSSYVQEEEKSKEKGDLKRRREEGSSGSSNSISPQERIPPSMMWERALKVARGLANKKCLGPSNPRCSSFSSDQETMKLNEKLMQKHGSISPVVGEGSFTKSKAISVPVYTGNNRMRVKPSSSSPHALEAKPCSKSKVCNLPYTKWPTTTRRGWLETGLRMGVTRPELYLSKRATQSDTNPNQHRLQLTKADILNSVPPLQVLAHKAEGAPVEVKVLDRKGDKYALTFKYLASSDTYRFMGPEYTQFLTGSKLKAGQVMCIWGLPICNIREQGQHWLAFINSDEDDEGIGSFLDESMKHLEGEYELGIQGEDEEFSDVELPLLSNWHVKL